VISPYEKEILLCHAFSITRAELITHPEKYPENNPKYLSMVERRLKHEPIAYIVGDQPFMGMDIMVDENVLIPRPETEELVLQILNNPKIQISKIVDVGTGSGCIAIALAKHFKDAKVYGVDSSDMALDVAKANAINQHLENRITFIMGHLLDPINEKVDLVVSNPPYIPSSEVDKLEPDVKDFEPRGALDGGAEGLDFIKEIIESAPNHLSPNGILYMEIGYDQGSRVYEYAKKFFNKVEITKDLSGKDRFVKCEQNPRDK